MKKEYTSIALVFAGIIVFLYPARWLRESWNEQYGESVENDLLSGILARSILLGVLILAARALRLETFNGWGRRPVLRNPQALLVPIGVPCVAIAANMDTYVEAGWPIVPYFVLSVLLIGLVEELGFRGIILPLLIRAGKDRPGVLLRSVFFSSLLFGLIHLVNLFRQPGNIDGVLSQVIFAFSIGALFGGLMLRTGNVVGVAIFHALVNFTFGTGTMKGPAPSPSAPPVETAIYWSQIIPTLLVFLFLLISGMVMARWADREKVVETL